jgi:hypothetical protein
MMSRRGRRPAKRWSELPAVGGGQPHARYRATVIGMFMYATSCGVPSSSTALLFAVEFASGLTIRVCVSDSDYLLYRRSSSLLLSRRSGFLLRIISWRRSKNPRRSKSVATLPRKTKPGWLRLHPPNQIGSTTIPGAMLRTGYRPKSHPTGNPVKTTPGAHQ